MEIIQTCPLGSECETARDNKIYRCRWYTKIRGKDPQSDTEVDEFRCAMAWLPVLSIEQSLHTRQTGAAVESFRNEMVSQNTDLLEHYKKSSGLLSG